MSRKVVCYIAMSADGFIARPDGSFDWLEKPREPVVEGHYGYADFVKGIDTVIWGRTTWDQVQDFAEGDAMISSAKTTNYVFTSDPQSRPAKPGVVYTNEAVAPFMERLRAEPGKDIWMMGGGKVIAAFLDAGEIDEFIVHVMPVYIGSGIPLIAPLQRDVEMKLVESKAYENGVVMLHYAVQTGRA